MGNWADSLANLPSARFFEDLGWQTPLLAQFEPQS